MNEELITYEFDPSEYLKTGCKPDLEHSEVFCNPGPEMAAEAERIANKFRLWMVLHPSYFSAYFPSFFGKIKMDVVIHPYKGKLRTNNYITSYEKEELEDEWLVREVGPSVLYGDKLKLCALCPHFGGRVNSPGCPEVRPVFLGCGVVRFVESKTDSLFINFPCVEWVRHV